VNRFLDALDGWDGVILLGALALGALALAVSP
jgi:hypothetical protein